MCTCYDKNRNSEKVRTYIYIFNIKENMNMKKRQTYGLCMKTGHPQKSVNVLPEQNIQTLHKKIIYIILL
jgi:ATP-dependent phosphoenolpyruvate carboxykinase